MEGLHAENLAEGQQKEKFEDVAFSGCISQHKMQVG
jgi:hypothetical protein